MLRPVADTTNESKINLETLTNKQNKYNLDTDRLMDAVFYQKRKTKNVFHMLQDEVTQLKADKVQHEMETTAKLDSFNRTVQDMTFAMQNH